MIILPDYSMRTVDNWLNLSADSKIFSVILFSHIFLLINHVTDKEQVLALKDLS